MKKTETKKAIRGLAYDFAMYSEKGNRAVEKALRDLRGTGRKNWPEALRRLHNLTSGNREATDTAVRDEAYRYVVGK